MEAGALGAEIIISGKLRTERARFEKFREGYLPKSGDPAIKSLHKAELHVKLKPGILGIKVRIMPSNIPFPDQVQISEIIPEEEKIEKEEVAQEPEKTKENEPQTTEATKTSKKKPEASEKETELKVSEESTEEAP
jgi:small subunit ribosomal protein S3